MIKEKYCPNGCISLQDSNKEECPYCGNDLIERSYYEEEIEIMSVNFDEQNYDFVRNNQDVFVVIRLEPSFLINGCFNSKEKAEEFIKDMEENYIIQKLEVK